MNKKTMNIILSVVGLATVYFFPEPETNFLMYLVVWLAIIIGFIFINKKV